MRDRFLKTLGETEDRLEALSEQVQTATQAAATSEKALEQKLQHLVVE